MVEIPIGRRGQLECPEADVIERFVVNAEGFISVLHQLMNRQGGIIWLHNSVRNLAVKKKHQSNSIVIFLVFNKDVSVW